MLLYDPPAIRVLPYSHDDRSFPEKIIDQAIGGCDVVPFIPISGPGTLAPWEKDVRVGRDGIPAKRAKGARVGNRQILGKAVEADV